MKLDALYVVTFFSVLVRLGAVMLSNPMIGKAAPPLVRAFFCALVAFALSPVIQPYMPPVPETMADLIVLVGRDVLFGLLIGGCLQLVQSTFQVAGTMMDFQLGVSSAQAFNPTIDSYASPITQFNTMLATVILLLADGHHLMFRAFVESYQMPIGSVHFDAAFLATLTGLLFRLMLLAAQIAAPVSAVAVIVDVAAGVINKAVPQTQPFLIATPAKLGFGVLALAFGLPALVVAVSRSTHLVFDSVHVMMGGR